MIRIASTVPKSLKFRQFVKYDVLVPEFGSQFGGKGG